MSLVTRSTRLVVVNPGLSGKAPVREVGPKGQVRRKPRGVGLGDWVESWAQPVAVVIDSVAADFGLRTKVAGCRACSRRRHVFNRVLPDMGSWSVWRGAPGRAWGVLRVALRQARRPAAKGRKSASK